jgi:hypothetical protein
MTTEATPGALGSNDPLGLVERLRQRTLPKHGGREADAWAHHWNLTLGDSELHAEAGKALKQLEHEAAFYRRRVQALEQWQSRMRDPERTVVCDILANGFTLDPPVPRDRYELKA